MNVCGENQCTGCMACMNECPRKAIEIVDSVWAYNAVIQEDLCVRCDACRKVCPVNYPPDKNKPRRYYQGWSADPGQRLASSSGGAAAAISESFVRSGGYVCTCRFEAGRFCFGITNEIDELGRFAGSKYVKSDPGLVYQKVAVLLNNGEKVLFIGLPCQVAAVKRFVGMQRQEKLYTADLICHGTPSPEVLKQFLREHGCELDGVRDIQFRVKDSFQLRDGERVFSPAGVQDSYSVAFLDSLSYTENCYSCPYAGIERVSDLTLGDSWGSELDTAEIKKGLSLILCQTEKGEALVSGAKLDLRDVNIQSAIENNGQLKHPSIRPRGRKWFVKWFSAIGFDRLVFLCLPNRSMRQFIKKVLIKMGVLRPGGGIEYKIVIFIRHGTESGG